jgi:hypothetical protein
LLSDNKETYDPDECFCASLMAVFEMPRQPGGDTKPGLIRVLGWGAQERRKRKAAGQEVVGGGDDIFARFRRATAAPPGKRVRGVDPTVNVAADTFDKLAPGFGLSHKATLVGSLFSELVAWILLMPPSLALSK